MDRGTGSHRLLPEAVSDGLRRPDARARARARANLEAFALEQEDPQSWFAEIISSLGLHPNLD
jgi:hypothetical protein